MLDYYRNYEKNLLLYDVIKECHIVDWPRKPYDFTDGYDFDLEWGRTHGTHNVMNAFYIGAHKNMYDICDILGKDHENRVPELKKAYVEAFYDSSSRLFRDTPESSHRSLHSNVLPLYYRIAPAESVNSIIGLIKDKRFNCGVYMAYFLLKALANYGGYELIYQLLVSEDVFSWSNMVREGASTCFETWGKEYKWNTSLCHPWASAPISILIEDIMGITPKQPGWKSGYNFNPRVSGKLRDVDASFWVNGYKIDIKMPSEKQRQGEGVSN
jgi:alpha-L-rhamnosidase